MNLNPHSPRIAMLMMGLGLTTAILGITSVILLFMMLALWTFIPETLYVFGITALFLATTAELNQYLEKKLDEKTKL